MKAKICWVFALLTLSVLTSRAQSKLTEEQKKELKEKQAEYKAKLNLTPDQETKMEAINTTYIEGLSALKEGSGSRLSKYKQLKKLNNDRDAGMKKILDANQYQLYKEQQQDMKKEFKKNRKQ